MGDGTEGIFGWRRPAKREVRKSDLQLVLDMLPYIYEINPKHHLLRQIVREIRAVHVTSHTEDGIVAALKAINDRVGFLVKDSAYYATPEAAQQDRPTAWYYKCVLDEAEAREKILDMAGRRFKTQLFESHVRARGMASLDEFI